MQKETVHLFQRDIQATYEEGGKLILKGVLYIAFNLSQLPGLFK